ncbi:trichothecene 3-O-acetyltransferase [Fusarium proliferatum ET1]|uniref:Trichothecene 3-O-acetyltransferase n=1 Tax=Fusarium proliferatum (strain ET1) TaxID=1227346 RepID=A0A1L7VX83_FUSPR|nr:trichothecene 3-O-acetyltransferase [Fusarium proliferatum ET1]CZR45045.1 trichothecene 3-O-acetyltransferase [Fusarium proliferatum ET1]
MSKLAQIYNHDTSAFQDVMSQFPALNGHTQLILGFKLPPETHRKAVTDALENALSSLTHQIDWLGGQVIEKDGILLPVPWPEDGPKNEILRRKDCDTLLPTMHDLIGRGVPISELDAGIVSPFPGLSAGHRLEPPVPIVALQANFISGGMLLTMCFHHIVMDGTAAFQFIRHLASALEGKQISPTDLVQANRDRRSVVRLLSPGEPIKDYTDLRRPPGFTYPPVLSTPAWCYFKLPIAALKALMKIALTQLSASSSHNGLLSENDVICAFCWQRISTVRLSTQTPGTVSKFSRAIDGRLAGGIPLGYMGHVVYHANLRLPLQHIASSSLGDIAYRLRKALDSSNNEWTLRSYATFIAREPDKSLLLYGGKTNPNTDLGATSALAGDDLRPSAFGALLGPSCFLRRPKTTPITGSISMSPIEGDYIPICLCLPSVDLELLKADSEWKRYIRIIG